MPDCQLASPEIEVRACEDLVVVGVADELVQAARVVAVLVHGDVADLFRLRLVRERHAGRAGHREAYGRALASPLDAAEEERGIPENRPAEGATELFVVEGRDGTVVDPVTDEILVTPHVKRGSA